MNIFCHLKDIWNCNFCQMYKLRKASNWTVGNTATLEHVELIRGNSILYFPDTSDTYTAVMLKWIYYEKAS